MPRIRITDADDPRLADYAALTDTALRKRYEHENGVLIAEGPNPVRQLIASPYPLRSLLVAEERLGPLEDVVHDLDVPIYVVSRELLHDVVRFRLHQGVLGCGLRLPPTPVADVATDARRLLVLEGCNDHENLGTLFRTARGLGVDGVVLGPACADPLYRRSVRVSMGHVLHVRHARSRDLPALLAWLANDGVSTIALTPHPAAPGLFTAAPPLARAALLLGAEGPGLTETTMAAATMRCRIPMENGVDSLNVAAAGAIALAWLRSAVDRE